MRKFVLSPCGTSLLTNASNSDERRLVTKYANAKNIEDAIDKDALEKRINTVKNNLLNASIDDAKKMSAELNGIISLYSGHILPSSSQDYHVLLCTDTWLGEQTANLVESWLKKYHLTTEIRRQVDLQTNNLESFQVALSELVKWCDDDIKNYKNSQYRIIFNLTGGFKSVQGFLQTLALFYADESVYIFETGNELLRIPRLPIKMVELDYVRDNLTSFRKLSLGLNVKQEFIENIPETLLLKIDQQKTLSAWGEIVWKNVKQDIYKKEVYEPLTERVKFSQKFLKSIENLEADRIELINGQIDLLCRYTIQNNMLHFHEFKNIKGNPKPPYTHELYAWTDGDARRIFCYYEKDGTLILGELGAHLR